MFKTLENNSWKDLTTVESRVSVVSKGILLYQKLRITCRE